MSVSVKLVTSWKRGPSLTSFRLSCCLEELEICKTTDEHTAHEELNAKPDWYIDHERAHQMCACFPLDSTLRVGLKKQTTHVQRIQVAADLGQSKKASFCS